jgi:hypothetical protein
MRIIKMSSIFKPIGIIRVFPTLEKIFTLPDTMSLQNKISIYGFLNRWVLIIANVVVTINYKSIE